MKKKIIFLILIVVCVVIFDLVHFSYQFNQRCGFSTDKTKCFTDRLYAVVQEDGLDAGFTYLDEVVWPQSRYQIAHLVVHELGHLAWDYADNVTDALYFAPYKEFTWEEFWKYEGFAHGVYHQYFFYEWDGESVLDLLSICPTYPEIIDRNVDLGELRMEMCAHAFGHGMFTTNYNIDESLQFCNGFPMQHRPNCYRGVFMELIFSQYMYYEKPTDFTISDSFTTICNLADDEQRAACSFFHMWEEMLVSESFNLAVNRCQSLPEKDKHNCIFGGALYVIPYLHNHDVSSMLDACEVFENDYFETCVRGIAIGLSIGTSGDVADFERFCSLTHNPSWCLALPDLIY